MEPLSGRELIFTLVLKVGWAAALAALLVRFRSFRRLLFTENRDSDQKVKLILFLVPPLAIGVMLRIFGGYRFFGSHTGRLVSAGAAGRASGWIAGGITGEPARLWQSRMARDAYGGAGGFAGGSCARSDPEKEDVWHFGPFLISEHSAMALGNWRGHQKGELGHAAAIHLRGISKLAWDRAR